MVSSYSTKARLREESNVSRKPIYVIANSENTSEQPQLYTRHRRKLPAESNDQLNALDDDVPLQEYQGVFGRPGIDFPVLSNIPVTKFNCRHVKNSNTGYYADTETNCQVFHVCDAGRKISFLCPNGTIFRQSHLICDWWFRVDCERSPELYDQSVQQLEADQNVHNNKQRVETIANAMQNAVSSRNSKEIPSLMPSPVPAMSRIKDGFNSESDLPNRNVDSSQRNTLRPNYQSSPDSVIRNNYNVITSPPRTSSFNTFTPTIPTTELPSISTRFQSSDNTRPSSGSTSSFTFVTSTYKPDVTPLIHNFLPPNDPGEGFREQQVLAETASFAGKGKYPFQNYYYMMNFIKHPSKENTNNKGSEFTTSNQAIETTQYQTESYTDSDDLYRTTFYPGNSNDFRDSGFINANNISENDNSSYVLYYSSTNDDVNSFGTTLPNELRGIPNLSSNASNPQVSEFILNSQSNSELNGETSTEQNLPLLTNMTQEAYNQLFPKDERVAEQSNVTNIFRNSDLATEHSSGIVQSENKKPQKQEILSNSLQFKTSPDLRELAQVFSQALSAYLDNPEKFRKTLSEVRPTEPPSTNENANGEASSIDDEVLAFSEDVGMKSTPGVTKSTQNTNTIPADFVTFTTPVPIKTTIKDPETFAEEINNFMFADPHNFLGHSESNEFNVNETYYPSSQHPFNATTRAQFTVSPLIDFTQNVSQFSPTPVPVTFTEAVPISSTFNGIPKNDNLYSDLKPQSNLEIGQSLSEKEHFITADTQSFVSRDNLLRLQNNLKPGQNFRPIVTTQNFKPSPVNQLPSISQPKYDADYQTIKSSKNMQFGMRTTSVTKAPFVASRNDFSSQTTPPSSLTTRTIPSSKATTYHPEVRTTRFSSYPTNDNYQPATNAVFDNRDPKSYNTDTYKDLSPNSGHFNETAKALMNMMEEAKSNNVLRHQLVLLLVNDKGLPTENKSVKEMKSKLLKALLKPAPDKPTTRSYRDNERISRSDNSSLVSPSSKARKERVVVHKHKVASPQTTDSISKSTVSSFQTRNDRSTSKPVVVAALTAPSESAELSESDSRAVELLKSLYTIASNNWAH